MEERGSLTREKMDEIFKDLAQNHFTGTLSTYDDDAWKEFYFASTGIRITSIGAKKALPIGEILYRMDFVDGTAIQATIERLKERPGLFGDTLIDLGYSHREDVDRGLSMQAKLELLDLFYWRRPTFEYKVGLQTGSSSVVEKRRRQTNTRSLSLSLQPHTLITDTRALYREITDLKTRVTHSSNVYCMSTRGKNKIFDTGAFKTLGALDQRVIILLDGKNTLQDLFAKARVLWVDVIRIIDKLLGHGAIEGTR